MDLKFSVIIPVYNVEKYLRKCLDSLVSQDYDNLEVIIVENASTDGCRKICLEYAQNYPSVKLITEEVNLGAGTARASGLKQVTGDYISFLDSDDYYEPNLFKEMSRILDEHPYDVVQYGTKSVNEFGHITKNHERISNEPGVYKGDECLKRVLLRKGINGFLWNKFYKKDLFDNFEYPASASGDDLVANIMIFLRVESVKCIPDMFYNYVKRSGSIRTSFSLKHIEWITYLGARFNHLKSIKPDFSAHYLMFLLCALVSAHGAAATAHDKAAKSQICKETRRLFKYYSNLVTIPSTVKRQFRLSERWAVALFRINPSVCSWIYRFLRRLLYSRV